MNPKPNLSLNAYPKPAQRVVGRLIQSEPDGQVEAVLVLPDSGKVEVLNALGAKIWTLADGTRTVREIAEAIWTEYEVEMDVAERDVQEFIGNLVQRGILLLSDHSEGGTPQGSSQAF